MLRHMHYKGIRIPVFILSILINALGIDLIIVAGFGSSPISSVTYRYQPVFELDLR